MSKKKIYFDQPQLPFEEHEPSDSPEAMEPHSSANEESGSGDGEEAPLRYISFGSGSSGNSC